jgi:glycosyltransferase involved in cell wall biosynthesis
MKEKYQATILVSIYSHPEIYPPTLNAISELSDIFSTVYLVYRNNLQGNWMYPNNIKEFVSGRFVSQKDQLYVSTVRKIRFFLGFLIDMYRKCYVTKPSIILVYDPIALYSYHLLRPFLFFKHKIWYHNHDVFELANQRKYSIGWFAVKTEPKTFKYLDLFTLPTHDRLKYFPLATLKGKYFIIPNYPSKRFYEKFYVPRQIEDKVKIIYQGSVSENHGIEEIIELLQQNKLSRPAYLVLKGPCNALYKQKLVDLATKYKVVDKLEFIGISPYAEVPIPGSKCHIGIAIFKSKDIMNVTLGTASNKIYEYAALGLPVLLYNTKQYRQHLGKYTWAFFTDCTEGEAIVHSLEKMISQFDILSKTAHQDFTKDLNFEHYFQPVKLYLLQLS